MPPQAEGDSPSSTTEDKNPDQTTSCIDEMEENTRDQYTPSADPMATASTMLASAIPDPSLETESHPRDYNTNAFEANNARLSNTGSSQGRAMTPKYGQVGSDHLFAGTGGSSGQDPSDTDIIHFEADIEGLPRPQRLDSHGCIQYKSLENLYGPLPINLKSSAMSEVLQLDRRSSGSSTFTSEPPGLTSRATTFSENGPFLDEANNHLSESPSATPGFAQRMLEFRSDNDTNPQDPAKPSRSFTREPLSYTKSPLSNSLKPMVADSTRYHGYRSPPASDAEESDEDENKYLLPRSLLPSARTDDDETSLSESECSDLTDEFDESHPLYAIKNAVVEQALLEYRQWKRSAPSAGRESTASGHTNANASMGDNSRQQAFGKRPRNDNHNDDDESDDEDGDEPPPKKPAPSPRSAAGTATLLFACPFAKGDRLNLTPCFPRLTEIKNVKQHLRRKHEAPVYCPICRDTFEDEDYLETHLRAPQRCERSNIPIPEGITPAQRKKLLKRADPRQSKVEQWFNIFDILFEGATRPKSPYIQDGVSREMQAFMDMMNERGPDIIMENITERDGLIHQLQDMGLRADHGEEQIIRELLTACITDGLQTLTGDWISNYSSRIAVPSLTEGETINSSTQAINTCPDKSTHGTRLQAPPSVDPNTTDISLMGEPSFTLDNMVADEGTFGDNVVYNPNMDDESMRTPSLNMGEWTSINTPMDPDLLQDTVDQKPMDQSMNMFDAFIHEDSGHPRVFD